jgi:hypothetical protein
LCDSRQIRIVRSSGARIVPLIKATTTTTTTNNEIDGCLSDSPPACHGLEHALASSTVEDGAGDDAAHSPSPVPAYRRNISSLRMKACLSPFTPVHAPFSPSACSDRFPSFTFSIVKDRRLMERPSRRRHDDGHVSVESRSPDWIVVTMFFRFSIRAETKEQLVQFGCQPTSFLERMTHSYPIK